MSNIYLSFGKQATIWCRIFVACAELYLDFELCKFFHSLRRKLLPFFILRSTISYPEIKFYFFVKFRQTVLFGYKDNNNRGFI